MVLLVLTRYRDCAEQPEILAGREAYATIFAPFILPLLGQEHLINGVQL